MRSTVLGIMVLMGSNCSAQRSLSKMKMIRNRLSPLIDSRMAVVSLEADIPCEAITVKLLINAAHRPLLCNTDLKLPVSDTAYTVC